MAVSVQSTYNVSSNSRTWLSGLLDSGPYQVVTDLVGKEQLAADISACREELARKIVDASVLITEEEAANTIKGGKWLRPLVVLATAYSSRDLSADGRHRAARAGVVVEMLHRASLVHDDVMDESSLRHGAATVNARLGNLRAVLVGDFFLAHGLASGCELGRAEGLLAAQAFIRLCEGQAKETVALYDIGRREQDYLDAIAGKTGTLFETASKLGAMANRLGPQSTEALARFGMNLGIAFQLLDDFLDFSASTSELGKPVGHDLIEGVYTLPVIRAIAERPKLVNLLKASEYEEEAAHAAIEFVRGSSSLHATLEMARDYAQLAVNELSGARDDLRPEGRATLAQLAKTLTAN